jgi:hypothetical protein
MWPDSGWNGHGAGAAALNSNAGASIGSNGGVSTSTSSAGGAATEALRPRRFSAPVIARLMRSTTTLQVGTGAWAVAGVEQGEKPTSREVARRRRRARAGFQQCSTPDLDMGVTMWAPGGDLRRDPHTVVVMVVGGLAVLSREKGTDDDAKATDVPKRCSRRTKPYWRDAI